MPTACPQPPVRAALARVDDIWDGPSPAPRRLTVSYLFTHHGVTGGLRVFVEHVIQLRRRGHRVRAITRGDARSAFPPWTDARADEDVVLPRGTPLGPGLTGSDVVVVGTYWPLPELLQVPVPALYLEQGHEILYGDVPDTPAGRSDAEGYRRAMQLPFACAAVSPFAAAALRERFGRRCGVIPNGIDSARFRPAPLPFAGRVLLVGNAALPFKGFDVALRALARVHAAVPALEVTWITQVPVRVDHLPFPVRLIVNPDHERLPTLYHGHDLLLFASWYEAFGLPPLEAMASGVPVVATQCGGILSYARPDKNCLLVPVGDDEGLARAAVRVLRDAALARRLSAAGRVTAEAFTWDKALDHLEDALLRVASAPRA